MTTPDERIAGRGRWIWMGGLIGALATGLPYLVYILCVLIHTTPQATGGGPLVDVILWIYTFVVGTVSASLPGIAAGVLVARWLTTFPGHRRVLHRYLLCGALIGALVWALELTGPLLYKSILQQVAELLGLMVIGGATGAFCGVEMATRAEDQLRESLDGSRRELEAAIEGKFGPLDEGRRAAIRGWDGDRLAEARRRLDDARDVDDLGV